MNELKKELDEVKTKLAEIEKKIDAKDINWLQKIKAHLSNMLPYEEYSLCKDVLGRFKPEYFINSKYLQKAVLTWIIQAVADILNEGSLDWSNGNQEKYNFYIDRNSNICHDCHYTDKHGTIGFRKDCIPQAREILFNLNGINILEEYFKL